MESTVETYERWHDGIGYDLEALAQFSAEERVEIEEWLIRRDAEWRDLEALAALGTPRAMAEVRSNLVGGSTESRLFAVRLLAADPDIGPAREAAIIDGLATTQFGTGLSAALDMAVEHPTPAVIDALFRCARGDNPTASVHAAAHLAYLHGRAREPFDWDRRPFFLRFGSDDAADRRTAFIELCGECGVDPAPYLD
jgi:hypothetical protein